ncbi:CHAT domain-containing protein [Microbacterium sp. RU33B]|uniref:CHAT domain-containing protein n=1 Tax=Microbacterium sp. RU33B TaxID=1907390 RepID=UPI00095DE58C|nr:CHAT domain-containing protein [Microbacterium sp. RU33B]SIT87316.1 CHAT domain-containing protein [Microbacterium sp. RU33B]
MARSPDALHRSAVDLVNAGRFVEAERLLARAARSADTADLRARIQGTLAVALAHHGAFAEAVATCEAALATPGLDRPTLALLTGQLGTIMERAGRLDDAYRWLGRAIDEVDDPVARANLLANRGNVGMQRRRLDDAARDTAAAAEIYAAHGRTIDEAEMRHNLGYIDLLRGDLVAALQQMLSARSVLGPVSPVHAAIGDVDRAEVLRDAGLPREAEALLAKAAVTFGSTRMPRSRAEAEFNLARSLLAHDAPQARRIASSSARRFDALGNAPWAARARALRLRAELSLDGLTRTGEVVASSRRVPPQVEVEVAASALDRIGLRSEAAALRMTRQLWRLRHGSTDLDTPVRVPPRASLDVRMLAHEVRAARAVARGRDGEARRHAARGLGELAEWQSEFGSLDLQTSVAMHGSGLIVSGLDSAIRTGRPDVAFEWSERARHLSQQVVPLRPPPDPGLAEDLAELRMLRADDPAGLDSARAAELRDRARERQWSGTGSAAVQQRITLDALRAGLDAETAVISFVFSTAGLAAVVATRDRARFVPIHGWADVRTALPGLRADLDMAASMRAGGVADVIRRSLDGRLAQLSRSLLHGPLAAAGDHRRIVVTVPGILNGIPWAMLPAMRGRSFTLAVSATRWAGLHAQTPPPVRSAGFVVGPRVPRADEEVTAASHTWATTRTLRGPEASVSAVTGLAHEVDVLHVSAHGRHSVDNPLFSGIELADGTLYGYDIDLIPEVPETVVLSACEVGRSSVRWGEEAIGMTRIWLHAGTRCVIASPVIVADDDACVLLGVMHEGLARGEAPADALAAASASTGIVAPFQAHGAGF